MLSNSPSGLGPFQSFSLIGSELASGPGEALQDGDICSSTVAHLNLVVTEFNEDNQGWRRNNQWSSGLLPSPPRLWASPLAQMVKNLPALQETQVHSVPGSGRSPGEGNGNPFQYSCLENPMDRGAWQVPIHGFPKSQTQQRD